MAERHFPRQRRAGLYRASIKKAHKDFPEEADYDAWLRSSLDYLLGLPELHNTRLTAAFSVYSLMLAIIHCEQDIPALESIGVGGRGLAERGEVVARLSGLLQELEEDEDAAQPGELFKAFEKGTNVLARRQTRAVYFLNAVSQD